MSHVRGFLIGMLGLIGTVASANTGTINVAVSSAPGEIELDGFPTGQTAPAIIDSVSPGDHLIELEYGCMVGSATVTVYRDQEAAADVRLENRGGEGTVRLRGLPRSASVFFDDAPLEGIDSGVQVACGGHRVRVEASGFEDWESMVVVTTGRWVTLEVAMIEGQIEESVSPVVAANDEARGGWDDDDDGWDEPVGQSREDLVRAERDARARASEERRAAEADDRARREAEEAEDRRREEEAALARAEREREMYGDLDSLDGPSGGDEEFEEERYEEDRYEEDRYEDEEFEDEEFEDEDSWDDEFRGYSDSGDDLDDDFGGGSSIRGSSDGKPTLLAGITTIAGLGGLGFGAYTYMAYQDSAEAWKTVAAEFGATSNEADGFWSQNTEPKYVMAITSLVAGGVMTSIGGGLFIFKVMGDDGGFVGFNGEW